ncbi:glycosyl transferase family protein [Phaeobacter sp. C3_T13_0]|uniref:glycosyl transferase family protein n=1 Tax=Phaeobacter cretensis TaxID=3342641 RepID=UPI0039BCA3B8
MSLSEYVRILGRGPGRARSLTQDEAFAAMSLMLRDDAVAEAVGAILMLLRMKGETAQEIAGFAAAAQAALPAMPQADLDWPSYAAGRTRGAPWFLKAAQTLANDGQRVLLHGWNGADPKVRAGLNDLGIGIAHSAADAPRLLDRDGIAYMPLEDLHPALFRLLRLRDVLGLRSCVNTVCRMLNPSYASASVQGVFHPSYRLLQADAAALLGWANLTIIKGGGGEFECHPSKDIEAFGLRARRPWQAVLPASMTDTRRLSEPSGAELSPRWASQSADAFEVAIIETTTHAARGTVAGADPIARNAAYEETPP